MAAGAWEGQVLLYSGGIMDQPGIGMDAINIFLAEKQKLKKKPGQK